ncbi:MAG: ABC transporter permease [Bacteroidales bacterium]
MLKYNLAAAFRSIKENLVFSLINISGFSIALTLVLILLVWLQFEFSFDKFHDNADRICRVFVEFKEKTSSDNFANTPAPLGSLLKNEIPEVADYVRFGQMGRMLVSYENKLFWEKIDLADPSIFKTFSFKLLSGNPLTALSNPGSIVISETKAKKYFGSEYPLGRTLLLGDDKSPYIITGVMKDIPANSQIQFDFLGSFSEIKGNLSWGNWNYSTYILAKNEASLRAISDKLPGFVKKIPDTENFELHIQPLTSIHLHSNLREDLPTNTNIKTVYAISSIIILILTIACINYINMATARYTRRGKEAGFRKVAGATNSNLAGQFLCESFTITCSAFILASILSCIFMRLVISLTGIPLDNISIWSLSFFVKCILLIFLISFISGIYPAVMLSSVNPVAALRDNFKLGKTVSVKNLRKGLVIFQFFVSIVLIACTIIIHLQMDFIRNKNLGLSDEQVIVVPIYQSEVKPKYELFKKEILTSSFILNASAVSYFPGSNYYHQNAWWEGLQKNDFSNGMSWIPVDQDFIKTLKLKMIKGENFPDNISGYGSKLYILNESAAKMIQWNDPIGKQFNIVGAGKVIGIVNDFNFKSLYSKIEPVALVSFPDAFDNLMIKISSENIPGTIEFIREKWKSLFNQTPFEFSFLSDDFQMMYDKEARTLKMITLISILSLFISCIGLFGLVLFTIDCRIREIGLRKISGSTSGEIVLLLNLEFVKWILVSFIIATPVIIYFMHKWLQSFAYRINLSWWMFATAGLIALIISLLTVSWLTSYTATRNPAECLRHE